MKKALCLTIALMLLWIPAALAGALDSRENEDINEVEIIEIIYDDDDDELPPTFPPETRPTAKPTDSPTSAPNPSASAAPEATPNATPADGLPEATPGPTTEIIEVSTVVVPVDPTDDTPPSIPVIEIVDTPEEIEEVYEDIDTTFDVTVIYISIDGTPVSDPVTVTVEAGQPIEIPSVTIENFSQTPVDLQDNIMPLRDLEITVIYVPEGFNDEILNISDYGTPLGIGASMMNVGVCVE